MRLTWSIPEPPQRDPLARLGRRWAVTYNGVEVSTLPKYSRFWSREKAEASAASHNKGEAIWVGLGLHQAREDGQERWAVTDLMDGAPDLAARALGIAESISGWMAAIGIAAMAILVIIWFAAAVA